MIVDPYVRTPTPPVVAVLLPDERRGVTILDELGRRWAPDELVPDLRVWGSYDVVHELVAAGHGEALCWNNEEIRWRHERLDADGWHTRPSDVAVIKLPFPENHRETLRALALWRDWLAGYGASPTGTSGSAAWSLLRARLERRLWTTVGTVPPIAWTLGGRQALGPAGRGRYQGELEQWDMPAAYATELGRLSYGGFWQRSSELPGPNREPAWWAQDGRPVFVRAQVTVEEQRYGPLPRRPRKRSTGLAAAFLGAEYPTGRRLQGVWTWQELEAMVETGAGRIVKVLEVWVHLASGQPFLPWLEAVEQGRTLPGLAGALAKTTGNALWGRFCMNGRDGTRTIRVRSRGGELEQRTVPARGGLPAAHDLAETVSGRVRSRLYRTMVAAGDGLRSAHTDGVWLDRELAPSTPAGWRRKGRARRLDLLDPQVLRYWPARTHPLEPFHVFAGMPAEHAPAMFEELWRAGGFAPTFEFGRAPTAVGAP